MTRRGLLLLLAVAGLVVFLNLRPTVPSTNLDGSLPPAGTFTSGFLAHLETVQEAADALVDLGERRERNLLVVAQGQSAMNAALDATDSWLAQQPTHQDDAAVAAYRSGANEIRQAMTDAQSAFLRLDWNGVAAANVTLREGVDNIRAAVEDLAAQDGN